VTKRLGAAALALMLVAAACGDDDATTATDAPTDDTDSPGTTASDVTTPANGTEPSTATTGATTADTAPTTGGDIGEAGCEATAPGTEITFSSFASPGQLDPILVAGGVVGGTEIAAIYDELFTYNYETNEVEPHLAEGITSNDDFTEFTLTLRDGITFSDGTPLDAQMVSDNIDRYLSDDATAPHGTFLALITEKTVVDPLTLEITMSRPWAEFPSFLAEQVGMIVNTNAVGSDVNAFAAIPPDAAGVGPFVVERNAPGEEIVLKARDDYWGGPVCVETLRIISIPGAAATYDAFKNGEVDVAFFRDPVTIAEAEAAGENGAYRTVDIGLEMLLNLRDGHAANDPRLREAIWLAMDPETMNERAYQGAFDLSASLISPDSSFGSDAIETVEPDPDRAAQLVAEAKADGLEANIEILTNTIPPAPDVALAWEGMLEAVGFEVTTSQKPVTEVVPQVFQANFDSANWALSIEAAQITTRLWGALHTEGINNRGAYSSAEMDAALVEAMSVPTEERAAAVTEINNIYVQDFVSPVFGPNQDGIIWQDDVSGVIIAPTDIYLFHDAVVEE
jgi:peptide/nickel transport system substrate-binding protein